MSTRAATPPKRRRSSRPAAVAASLMMARSMPTRTVPILPPAMGMPMSVIWRVARRAGSWYSISRTCRATLPGTGFLSTMPAGTTGEKVWAMSVFCGSYTRT